MQRRRINIGNTESLSRRNSHILGSAMIAGQERQELIDAYVRGKLDPQSAADFEEAYLQDAELLADLELTYALKHELSQMEYQPETGTGLAWVQKLRNSFLRPAGAFVATTAIVVSTLALTDLYQSRQDLLMDQQVLTALQPDVSIVTFSRLRSAREDTEFSAVLTPEQLTSGMAILEFEIDWPPQSEYEVSIATQGDSQLEPIVVNVRPDDRGYLVIAVPTSELQAGDYQIVISSTQEEVAEQEYSMRVNSIL